MANHHEVRRNMEPIDEYIKISGLYKTYVTPNGPLEVLKGIDLTVRKGEIFGIIGFSGAGKSTLVRCINRLEKADAGSIKVGGVEMLSLSKKELLQKRKKIGMIFQTFNLFEARNVYRSIAYPLEISGVPRKEIKRRVLETAELVGLSDKLKDYPGGLSGGQKQRVAIARALINKPKVLLLDEPMGALDSFSRADIQDKLLELHKENETTMILVTHDVDEAIYLSDRIVIMTPRPGKISEIMDINLPHPRHRGGTDFLYLRRTILEKIHLVSALPEPEYII